VKRTLGGGGMSLFLSQKKRTAGYIHIIASAVTILAVLAEILQVA
jgi:hypothetical protein